MREAPAGAPEGANARTRVELLGWQGGRALFRLWPETGRKHQLRLHLAGLGFPIENDRLYPTLQAEGPDDFTRPLQLLARRLAFEDPLSGGRVEVESRRQLAW
jgi:tRNA pseudouridine32 synthase / 23S rRNA pseudouridine746 synthase